MTAQPDADRPAAELTVDVRERGANQQVSERRLFVQLHAFSDCADPKPLVTGLERSATAAVLYADVNEPRGVGLLVMTDDPVLLVTRGREMLAAEPFVHLRRRPELTMLGRTYSSGFEADLEDWLIRRPQRTALNPAWPWAVWYPLRRTGAFARLSREEQGAILREHSTIGRAYGEADLAHDIRLACHGLDANDSDFVIGLVGRDLAPLSHLVQTMRRTVQTAQYIERLGPFFVGRAIWQSPIR
jgi:Chlorite dismutase